MSNYSLSTKVSWGQSYREIADEFRLWGVDEWEISQPRGARFQGWNQTEEDRTVDLRYKKNGREVVLSMGNQSRAVDNIRVLYLAINSMRLNEKRGISEVLQQAYKQLAAPEGAINIDPYKELGVMKGGDLEVYESVYRTMARKYHPDNKPDGSAERMERLNQAIKMIREELK